MLEDIKKIISYFDAGKYREAETYIWEIYQKYPNNFNIEKLLAFSLVKQNKHNGAINSYVKALAFKENDYECLLNLGYIYLHQSDFKKSEMSLLKAYENKKDDIGLLKNLGTLYFKLKLYTKSVSFFKDAFKISNRDSGLVEGYFKSLIALSEKKQAINLIENFLNKSFSPNIFFLMCRVSPARIEIRKINEAKKKLDTKLTYLDYAYIAFGIADYYDYHENYKDASNFYLDANEKVSKFIHSNPVLSQNNHAQIINLFKENFKNYNDSYSNSDDKTQHIFIVGMPRTGSTLIESMIGINENTATIGENIFIEKYIRRVLSEDKDSLKQTKKIFTNLNKDYQKYIKELSISEKIVINKHLNNYLFIGFILLSIPKAKIIYNIRDAADNCLSIFKQFFIGVNYSSRISHIAMEYSNHQHIMSFWKSIYKDKILDISYEELVSDPNRSSTKIYDFLCTKMEYNEEKRKDYFSETASQFQVRKQIYKTSVGNKNKYLEISAMFEKDILLQQEFWKKKS